MCILDTQMINGNFLELSCQLVFAVGPVPVVALAHLYKTACCLAEVHPYSDTSKFTKTDDTRNTLGQKFGKENAQVKGAKMTTHRLTHTKHKICRSICVSSFSRLLPEHELNKGKQKAKLLVDRKATGYPLYPQRG